MTELKIFTEKLLYLESKKYLSYKIHDYYADSYAKLSQEL